MVERAARDPQPAPGQAVLQAGLGRSGSSNQQVRAGVAAVLTKYLLHCAQH